MHFEFGNFNFKSAKNLFKGLLSPKVKGLLLQLEHELFSFDINSFIQELQNTAPHLTQETIFHINF